MQVSKLLVPAKFQEEHFFLYYDTHNHKDPESSTAGDLEKSADKQCTVLRKWLKKNEEATVNKEQQNEEATVSIGQQNEEATSSDEQ